MKKTIIIIFILVIIGFLSLLFINSKNKYNVIRADYKYLDNLNIQKPLNINKLEEHPKNFYVYAIEVKDLNNDNKNEIIYKEEENIVILNNVWKKQYNCFVGYSTNRMEYILIEDIDNNGTQEIITTGGTDSIFEKIRTKYSLGYGVWNEKNYVRVELNNRSGEINPSFIADLKKHINDFEFNNGNEIIFSKEDWEKVSSEQYSLKIIDNKCNIVSDHFISKHRQGTKTIIAKNIDNNPEKEIFVDLYLSSDGIYVLNNNKMSTIKSGDIYNTIIADINEKRYPISKEKIKEYKIGERIFLDDINNDNSKEIIALVQQPVSYVGNTKIFILSSSNGELLYKYTYPTWVNSATVADINGDGFKEIIVSGYANELFTVFGFSN